MTRSLGSDTVAATLARVTFLSPLVKSASITTGFGYVALGCAVFAVRTIGSSTVDLEDTDTAKNCLWKGKTAGFGFTIVYCQSPI